MGEDFVKPHQRSMEVHLNPARCARDILTMILCTPALHKAHANGTHFGELKDSLKSLVDTLGKKLSKILIVEDFERAAGRNLTHSGWMEVMGVVAVTTLDKYGAITEALSKHLTTNVEEMHSFSNVTTNILNGRVTVHIGQKSKAESICIHTRICVPIHHDMGACGMECFPYPLVQFIVGDRAPVWWLLVLYLYIGTIRGWGNGG